ncbi:unnamed protein product [Ectocarpus fasciculatus]
MCYTPFNPLQNLLQQSRDSRPIQNEMPPDYQKVNRIVYRFDSTHNRDQTIFIRASQPSSSSQVACDRPLTNHTASSQRPIRHPPHVGRTPPESTSPGEDNDVEIRRQTRGRSKQSNNKLLRSNKSSFSFRRFFFMT